MRPPSFVFDLNFDIPEEVINAIHEAPPVPLLYTQEDLDRACYDAFEKGKTVGFEAGYVEGELKAITDRQKHIQSTFVKIYESLEQILKQEKNYEAELPHTISQIIKTIIAKILPYYVEKYGHDEMLQAIMQILETIVEPEPLTIKISSQSLSDIQEKIQDIEKKYQGKVTLEADPKLQPFECNIEWRGGGARWSQPTTFLKIEEIFNETINHQ